jgi:ABC-type Fe3+-hydroxamate transport system substrate-binding protein
MAEETAFADLPPFRRGRKDIGMRTARDDIGMELRLPARARRVVSLVPSLTEAVASCDRTVLAGATRWCAHPEDLSVPRFGGTKNPDVPGIIAIKPDLVLGNEEENREADLAALRAAGLAVWVTRVRSLPEALVSLNRMLAQGCGLPRPAWLDAAQRVWRHAERERQAAPERGDRGTRSAIVPVWRRPWMVLGRDTFAGDLLARLGVRNVYAEHEQRYPKIALDELRRCGAELVVLPDEPYRFTAADGPEAFPGIPAVLISGRHLTWYGPSLATAPAVLAQQLDLPQSSPGA